MLDSEIIINKPKIFLWSMGGMGLGRLSERKRDLLDNLLERRSLRHRAVAKFMVIGA